MKKLLSVLVLLLLFTFSCTEGEKVIEDQNKNSGSNEIKTPVKDEVKINYYYDMCSNYSVTVKKEEIKLPSYILPYGVEPREDFAFNKNFEVTSEKTNNGKEYYKFHNMTSDRRVAIQVEWYLDENFENKVDTEKITKDCTLFAKPLAIFTMLYKIDDSKIGKLGLEDFTADSNSKAASHLLFIYSFVDELTIKKNNDILFFYNTDLIKYPVENNPFATPKIESLDLTAISIKPSTDRNYLFELNQMIKKAPKKVIFDAEYFTNYYDDEVKLWENVLGYNDSFEEIEINGDLKSIDTYAIRSLSELKTITINGKVGSIAKAAVLNMPVLEKLVINSCDNVDAECFKTVNENCELVILDKVDK